MKHFLILVFLLSRFITNAQNTEYKLQNLHPISPSAFEFLKYGEIPVSDYNGIANVSIPLHTIQLDEAVMPINLQYHGGGLRVNQEASWVGLGWDLSLGNIYQEINDEDDYGVGNVRLLPDYHNSPLPTEFPYRFNYISGYPAAGFGWTNPFPQHETQPYHSYKIATAYYVPINGDFDNQNLGRSIFIDNNYDSEPDIFKLSIMGHDLKFIRNLHNGLITVLNRKGYNVNRIGENFEVITPDGTRYEFNEKISILSQSTTTGGIGGVGGSPQKISSKIWYITKIVTKKGNEIVISYQKTSQAQKNFPNYSESKTDYTLVNSVTSSAQYDDSHLGYIGLLLGNNAKTYSYSEEVRIVPTKIEFPNGKIEFIASNSRSDLIGGFQLDKIKISGDRNTKEYLFSYSYFNSATLTGNKYAIGNEFANASNLRLKLNSVTNPDGSKYELVYNSAALPAKNSFAQDFWGYYNGHLNNNSLLPNPSRFGYSANNGNNKSANLNFATACILERLIYPTGGYTDFEYELNQFGNYWVPDYSTTTNTISSGNGIRIKSIINYHSQNFIANKNIYTYENGISFLPLQFFRQYPINTINYQTASIIDRNTYQIDEVNSSGFYSSNLLGTGNGVGYTKVRVTAVNNAGQNSGFIEKTFHNTVDNVSASFNGTSQLSVQLPSIKKYNGAVNGLMLKEEIFNSDNEIQQTVENQYSTKLSEIHYGARIFGYLSLLYKECGAGYCNWVNVPQNLIGYYPLFDIESLLIKSIVTEYSEGNTIVTTKNFDYDIYNQMNYTQVKNSNGTYNIDYFYKAYDYHQRTGNNILIQNNWLSEIAEVRSIVRPPDYSTYKLKSRFKKNYEVINDKLCVEKVSIYNLANENIIDKEIKFDEYDDYGNALEVYTTDGLITSNIYDYNSQLLVAEIINSDYASNAYNSFEANGFGNWNFNSNGINKTIGFTGRQSFGLLGYDIWKNDLNPNKKYILSFWSKSGTPGVNINHSGGGSSTVLYDGMPPKQTIGEWNYFELTIQNAVGIGIWKWGHLTQTYVDELRLYPDDAQMITYTYDPLVGVSSHTDINNKVISYEYDNFGRLKLVRDHGGKIQQYYCYNFYGQAENCAVYYNETQIGIFTTECSSGQIGADYEYIVSEGKYYASSVEEANLLALDDLNTNGPIEANIHGYCLFTSANYSGNYYSQNCGFQTPAPYYVSVPAGLFTGTSQQDADYQALQYAQSQANQYGNCQSAVNLNYTNATPGYIYVILTDVNTWESHYFEVMGSGSGFLGSVPAGMYNVEIGNYMSYTYNYVIGCGNYIYGATAYLYNIEISEVCNEISIYY